jgi:dGTPase
MSSIEPLENRRNARLHPPKGDNPGDRRSPGRRDRDRILYSSAFRRLSGITQVVSATDRHPIHNRLTHTLEVAQIGRSLAEELLRGEANRDRASQLGGLDPDVVEAAALAHDLGHPPFGHVAEAELHRLVKT